MDRIWRQSRREQSQLTIMLIDIDHFKAFNDLYGHQAGDDALKRVAEVIAMGAQRPLDFAARYGGEEFALVLYGPANDFGRDLPEQIRQKVESLAIPHVEASAGARLTISIGVAIVTPGAERSLAGAIQMADEALYQAKEEGRNRVVVKESRSTHIETGRFRAARKRPPGSTRFSCGRPFDGRVPHRAGLSQRVRTSFIPQSLGHRLSTGMDAEPRYVTQSRDSDRPGRLAQPATSARYWAWTSTVPAAEEPCLSAAVRSRCCPVSARKPCGRRGAGG